MPAKKTTTKKTAAAKKTPAKKAPAKPAATKKAASKKTASRKAPARKSKKQALSPEERFRQIQEAAYYIAEKSNWTRDPTACWIEAEALIARLQNA